MVGLLTTQTTQVLALQIEELFTLIYNPRGFDIGPVARNSRISAEPLPSPSPVGVYEGPDEF